MEKGLGPMFTFLTDELNNRGDLSFEDLKRMSQAYWIKEHIEGKTIPELNYVALLENLKQQFTQYLNDPDITNFDVISCLDFHNTGFPALPEKYSKMYFDIEKNVL